MSKMFADCPICNAHQSMEVTTKTEKIPYFGEIMESTLLCSECGYKHSDTICIDQKDPVKYTLIVGKDNLNARVVKSQSTTITIPEIGLKVEPGPQSQGYVSNVEGVLNRFEKAVKTALSWAEEDHAKKNAVQILEDIERVKNGQKEVTLVLEDPFGHSIVMDEMAVKSELTVEEIENLETGFTTFENGELEKMNR
ncbi:ZPR1 zinc finger domain-containing protein [Methanobacterium formicicum]|uniref:ZPR1-related zinc finger protein n=1 Tax=Methanobacterium formicicum (strain DSM 3637 / PP1) TaxID=1204725 RepID=K2R0H0_METFP|nr:ZPR1 zinc finger domain-containing protein [Methanobacterium formicicum]EKF84677.1 ZPR1-related zinc finger protein [Methanobacterium formicicum DSM 3637]